MTNDDNEKTYMGIPLHRFADRDSYVGRRLIRGDKRGLIRPQQNGIPKTKVKSGPAPTSADIFGFTPLSLRDDN